MTKRVLVLAVAATLAACGSGAEESVRNGPGEAGTQGGNVGAATQAPAPAAATGQTTAVGGTTTAGVGAPTTLPAGATAGATTGATGAARAPRP